MRQAQDTPPIAIPEETRRTIEQLVERYQRNADEYSSKEYKEASVRQEFVDPFFGALGWDMANEQGFAEQYKEVVYEPSLKVGEETKAPDYSFRIGGQRKFFLEAKKPSVDVKGDAEPAYQLRRYAWSAKLPLSVLTNFREFAVYDCSKRPKESDSASVARIRFITYDQYIECLEDMYSVFAKEAILKGSFDRYAQDARRKRGTTEVDVEFLREIEAWREMLAKDIAKNNPGLSVHDLNFAVQATIDRILFFRIAEDRGVEAYGRLQGLINGSRLYPSLCDLYHQAEEKYNAGLFDFSARGDVLCPQLTISDSVLKAILSKLYYPECPYEFSVLGADILGAVYEQFLGKVIRLTPSGRAKVEEKPEVKKAGGVYYTPTYIVEYIVEHTVGEALKQAGTPEKASKLRILDPACGSGSFLLGAYERLLRWHLDYYTGNNPKKHARGGQATIVETGENAWRLSLFERKRILQNNIYGVDIDPQAVEVTKLNLLLKCMEGEPGELRLAQERVLPNIDDNIKCGNSLIGPDYYQGRQQRMFDDEEARRVNAFDWEAEFRDIMSAGGFDCVIGNPPYVFGRDWSTLGIEDGFKEYFKREYSEAAYQMDMFSLFMERAYDVARSTGIVGQIVPNVWLTNSFSANTRRLVLAKSASLRIAEAPADTFRTGVVDTVVYVSRKGATAGTRFSIWRISSSGAEHVCTCEREDYADGMAPISTTTSAACQGVVSKLREGAQELNDVARVTRGIHSYRTGGYGRSAFGPGPQTRRDIQERPYHSDVPLPNYRPFVRGRDLARFAPVAHSGFVKYGPWLAEPRDPFFFEGKRIYSRKILAERLVATLADGSSVGDQQVYITKVTARCVEAEYLLGVMASRVIAFYILHYFSEGGDQFPQIKVGQLKSVPIPSIDFSDPADVARHDKMVGLVERMLDLHKRLPEAKTQRDRELLQRQIDATDGDIDKLVYDLYGLTDEEIAIVEEAGRKD